MGALSSFSKARVSARMPSTLSAGIKDTAPMRNGAVPTISSRALSVEAFAANRSVRFSNAGVSASMTTVCRSRSALPHTRLTRAEPAPAKTIRPVYSRPATIPMPSWTMPLPAGTNGVCAPT